jgi:hypothetical protein
MVRTPANSIRAAISPDSKFVAFWYIDDEKPGSSWRIGVVPADGGALVKSFEMPGSATPRGFHCSFFFRLRWNAESDALLYTNSRSGVSNIWSQPLAGGDPRQITQF